MVDNIDPPIGEKTQEIQNLLGALQNFVNEDVDVLEYFTMVNEFAENVIQPVFENYDFCEQVPPHMKRGPYSSCKVEGSDYQYTLKQIEDGQNLMNENTIPAYNKDMLQPLAIRKQPSRVIQRLDQQ